MKRFYPKFVPEFLYEPTTDKFRIGKVSDCVGEGVVAKVDFRKGDIVSGFTGFMINEITQFSLTYREGIHVHDPYFMGKVLHSCDPNTYCDMEQRIFFAVKDIRAGELVTMDYEQTEPVLFKTFNCRCGSPLCRGRIGVPRRAAEELMPTLSQPVRRVAVRRELEQPVHA